MERGIWSLHVEVLEQPSLDKSGNHIHYPPIPDISTYPDMWTYFLEESDNIIIPLTRPFPILMSRFLA